MPLDQSGGQLQHEVRPGDICYLCAKALKGGDVAVFMDDLDDLGFGVRFWAHESCTTLGEPEKEWPE